MGVYQRSSSRLTDDCHMSCHIWVILITTEACSPEAWKSMGLDIGESSPVGGPTIQVSEILFHLPRPMENHNF
jgi:hypothetical protein